MPEVVHVQADDKGGGNADGDGKSPPGALGQGVDDDDRQPGQGGDDYEQDGDGRGDAGSFADVVAGELVERKAVMPDGSEEHYVIVDRAGQHGADNDPDRAGQEAELRREDRADQRPRAGDGREVMAEQDPFISRVIIVAVIEPDGRGDFFRIKRQDFSRQKGRIIAIGQRKNAEGDN